MFRPHIDHHNNVIKLMQQLGYKSHDNGICHGITLMAMQACASGGIKTFNNRLIFIKKHPNLKMAIEQFREKFAKRNSTTAKPNALKLTQDEQKIINVMAFFDGIEIHYNPELYAGWFSEPVSYLNSDKILQLTASKKLERKGGLIKIMSWPGIYDTQELSDYCRLLDDVASTLKQPFSILFSNSQHTTALHYDPRLPGWYSLDANQLPIRPVNINLAIWLKDALDEKSDITAFESSVFFSGNSCQAQKELINAFNSSNQFAKLHEITAKKANYENNKGNSLAFIAAQYGHAEIITALHNTKSIDLNKMNLHGTSLAYIAAKNGHVEVISALSNAGVNLSNPAKKGKTPAFVAARENQVLALMALEEAGVDLKQKTPYGSPLRIAKNHSVLGSIKFLKDYITRKSNPDNIAFFTTAPKNSRKKIKKKRCG